MLMQLKRFLKYASLLVLIPIVLFALYIWAALTWVYSSGERAGFVQKLSHKGWVCKTYEGELVLVSMPGTQAEKFYFTVRDAAIVQKINDTVGSRVRLVYEEHKGLPSTCFGETSYFVTNVKLIDKTE
jgi:hypothetical protein